jgi:hypothetical protein
MNAKRPLYETQTNLDNEQGVAAVIARRWNCVLVKLPIKYSLDFALTRQNKVVSFCEFKNRNYTMQQIANMGGYTLGLNKWLNAQILCKSIGVPFVLVVQTIDKKIWYSIFKDDFLNMPTYIKGRTDRNDWQDIEPCVMLDVSAFTLLQETTQ